MRRRRPPAACFVSSSTTSAAIIFIAATVAHSAPPAYEAPGLTLTTNLLIEFIVSGAILAGLVVGGAAGWANGFAITRFSQPPFVATLGMFSIARGLTMLWTGGFPITGLGDSFGHLGTGAFVGMPMPVWIMLALTAMFVVVTKRTRFGRHLYAVGGNERAARLTGLNVSRIKIAVYTLAGALAGVAA